jgi:type IX secretion system PorP/SprF family membrane protein
MTEVAFAQQQVMFTQYMFNNLAINPAYAGSQEALSMTALARTQWIGIEGAPKTQTFSAHTPIPRKNIGVGLQFIRDEIGVSVENSFVASYAYKVGLGKGKLSMGMQAGFSNFQNNLNDLSISDDGLFAGGIQIFVPNVGMGFWYNTKRFYAGLSAPYLLNRQLQGNGVDLNTKQVRHYYAQLGYVFDINSDLKIKPHMLAKIVDGAPVAMDFSANLIIKDIVWVGASYRSFDSIDFLFELQINQQMKVGYAYDYTVSDLNKVNSGSHEVFVQYIFAFSRYKVVTPRYF